MKIYSILALVAGAAATADPTQYDILSIEGVGMKGMIPAYWIEQMETIAYDVVSKGYKDKNANPAGVDKCYNTLTNWL